MVWTTIADLARDGHIGKEQLYRLARRADDPLPLRYFEGDRYGRVLVSEFEAWLVRNTKLWKEAKDGR